MVASPSIEDTPEPARDAGPWHERLQLANKAERDWRKEAGQIVERYRGDTKSRLNILAANIELLKSSVYGRAPEPEVRRRALFEDPIRQQVGLMVAELLENALEYAIDSAPFDEAMERVRDDMLLTGRGVARVTYDSEIVRRDDILRVPGVPELGQPDTYYLDGRPVEPEFDDSGSPYIDEKLNEEVHVEHVFWSDFRCEPARRWGDVSWCAFRHTMSRKELRAEFGGGDVMLVPLSVSGTSGEIYDRVDPDSQAPADPPAHKSKAIVWEIWSKNTGERIWVAEGHDKALRTDPDPLGLEGFFPCAEPLRHITTTDSLVPIPEFRLWAEQAKELDEVQDRIRHLVRVAKAVALVDGDFAEVVKIATACDGEAIPIERPNATAEDLASGVWWWPLGEVTSTLGVLSARAAELKNQIWELSGISDLQRGVAEPRVSASAERTKAGYSQVRMTPRSIPMARFVRDTLRIMAEVMAEMFDPETLSEIGGMPVGPEMLEMMRAEKLRTCTITVATDSTLRPDPQAEKAEAVEFMQALSSFANEFATIAPVVPQLAPLLLEAFKVAARPFKLGRQLEDKVTQTADLLEQAAMAPPPAPMGPPVAQTPTGYAA